MFWKFAPMISQIDTVLDSENVTLIEVLEEEDVIQECKSCNKKLINFLTDSDRLQHLVRLIVEDPPFNEQETTRYKFANIACELLTCDVIDMNKAIVSDNVYLDIMYNLLNKEPPLNPLSASFLMKVFVLLISKECTRIISYLKSKENFLDRILLHLSTSAVVDLLLRLIAIIDVTDLRVDVSNWFIKNQLVPRLVKCFELSSDSEKHYNAARILCNLITTAREQLSQNEAAHEITALLDCLESTETLAALFDNVLQCSEPTESALTSTIVVIQTMLNQVKNETGIDILPATLNELGFARLQAVSCRVVETIAPRMCRLRYVLENPPSQYFAVMPTTLGVLSPPLGNTRLHVCQLLYHILAINNEIGNCAFYEAGLLSIILNLFFCYPFNTFLHLVVERAVRAILQNSLNEPISSKDIGKGDDTQPKCTGQLLIRQLLVECDLLGRILERWSENELLESRPRAYRQGCIVYMGRMANCFVDNLKNGVNKQIIEAVFEDLNETLLTNWKSFVDVQLTEFNRKNTVEMNNLGNDFASSSDDEDSDFQSISFPENMAFQNMQKMYTEYQEQQLTTAFMDQFGFHEEEFHETNNDKLDSYFSDRASSLDFSLPTNEDTSNATTFEQACNEQIRQFDDSIEDEDVVDLDDSNVENACSTGAHAANIVVGEPSEDDIKLGAYEEDYEAICSDDEIDLSSPVVIRSRNVGHETHRGSNFSDIGPDTAAAPDFNATQVLQCDDNDGATSWSNCEVLAADESADNLSDGVMLNSSSGNEESMTSNNGFELKACNRTTQVQSCQGDSNDFVVDWPSFGDSSTDEIGFVDLCGEIPVAEVASDSESVNLFADTVAGDGVEKRKNPYLISDAHCESMEEEELPQETIFMSNLIDNITVTQLVSQCNQLIEDISLSPKQLAGKSLSTSTVESSAEAQSPNCMPVDVELQVNCNGSSFDS